MQFCSPLTIISSLLQNKHLASERVSEARSRRSENRTFADATTGT